MTLTITLNNQELFQLFIITWTILSARVIQNPRKCTLYISVFRLWQPYKNLLINVGSLFKTVTHSARFDSPLRTSQVHQRQPRHFLPRNPCGCVAQCLREYNTEDRVRTGRFAVHVRSGHGSRFVALCHKIVDVLGEEKKNFIKSLCI